MISFGLLAACIWLISIAPLVLEALSGGDLALLGAPRIVVVALPWLALSGVPRCGASSSVLLASALVPLGLALDLDLQDGLLGGSHGLLLLGTLALCLGWAWLAQRARTRPDRRRRYAWLWLLSVPLPAVYRVSHLWASGSADDDVARAWSLDPVLWLFDHGRGQVLVGWSSLILPLAGLSVCALLVLFPPSRADPRSLA